MKKIYLLATAILFVATMHAQVVFQSDLSSWSGGNPTDWMGSKTSIENDSVVEITSGADCGTSAAQLINEESTHKRFTTQEVHVDKDSVYEISFWVKGEGDIRTAMWEGSYTAYNSYISVNTSSWTKYTQSVTAPGTGDDGQFIISIRNTVAGSGHLELDSVVIKMKSSVVTPIELTIAEIQDTTGTGSEASPYADSVAITGGIVTAVSNYGYFIQSGTGMWSGLFISDTNKPSLGDSVKLQGTVYEKNNLTELKSITSYTVVSSGNTVPTPTSLSTADANLEGYESVLIKVSSAVCLTADLGYGEWSVKDASSDSVRIDDMMYTFSAVEDSAYDITGVLNYSYGNFKIEPRNRDDINGPEKLTPVTIHDIQYTTDVSGDSPYKDSVVLTGGIITVVVPNKGYFLQAGSGAWNGIYVYNDNDSVARGDSITLKAKVSEYNNLTELSSVSDLVIVSSGNALPTAISVASANVSEEQYESVLIKSAGTCLSNDLGYGEWGISDNSTDTVHIDDLFYAFSPIVDSSYTVTGINYYSYGSFKIEPRDSADIVGPRMTSSAVSIHDIQYTTDASGDSPYAGTTVSTGGIVTAILPDKGYFLQSGSGAWNGIYVYDKDNAVDRGDSVTFTADVSEYYNLTELSSVTDFVKVSTGNTLPAAATLSSADVNKENYECVLVKTQAPCIDPDLGYGEWALSDNGGTDTSRIDDLLYVFTPIKDSTYTVTGIDYYTYGAYKIEPRDSNDVIGPRKNTSMVSIHDIQYTTDASGDSPYNDSTVSTGGIVTAILSGKGYFLQSGSGAWNGIYVYDKNNAVARGDSITFTAKVSEYYNLTELSSITDFTKVSTGNTLPTAANLSSADVNKEDYECVLIKTQAPCINPDLGYGEWALSDNGGTDTARIDDLLYAFSPIKDSTYTVTGIDYYTYGAYKVEPRDSNDIIGPAYVLQTVSIHDIQYTTDASGDSPYDGMQVSTGGIVTAIVEGKGYFLQSGSGAWNGVYVYDKNDTVARGDSVTFTTKVSEYYTFTELGYVTDFVKVSSGNALPTPLSLTTGDVANEKYEGVLVTIKGTCTNPDLGYGKWELDDGTGAATIDSLMYPYSPTSYEIYTVTGPVNYNHDYAVSPRDINDIVKETGIISPANNNTLRVYPNPATGLFTVEASDVMSKISIFNILGSEVMNMNPNAKQQTIHVETLKAGIYFVKISTKKETKTVKIKIIN